MFKLCDQDTLSYYFVIERGHIKHTVAHAGKSSICAQATGGKGLVSFAALVLRLWLSRLMQELMAQDKAIVNSFPIIGMETVNRAQEEA